MESIPHAPSNPGAASNSGTAATAPPLRDAAAAASSPQSTPPDTVGSQATQAAPPGAGAQAAAAPPLSAPVPAPPISVAGVPAAALSATSLSAPTSLWENAEQYAIYFAVAALIFTLIVPLALFVTEPSNDPKRADEKALMLGLTLLFGSFTVLFLARLAGSLDRGETFAVETHWGGLGGGVGGWRISRPIAYIVCLMTFGALMAYTVSRYPGPLPPPQPTTQNAPGQSARPQTADATKTAAQTKQGSKTEPIQDAPAPAQPDGATSATPPVTPATPAGK